jgi:hypothetical protein
MFEEAFTLHWEVPIDGDGFAWVPYRRAGESQVASGQALVAREGTKFKTYAPMKAGIALHRELARTATTPEGILGFANRYGRLGAGAEEQADITSMTLGQIPSKYFPVEPFHRWHYHIVWVSEAVRLWDLIQEEDREVLGKVIRWQGGLVYYAPPPEVEKALGGRSWDQVPEQERKSYKGYDLLGHAADSATLKARVEPGDVVLPALLFVHSLINADLFLQVGPQLFWDARRNRTVLQQYPRSLLGAIYLQFAQEIRSRRKSRVCPVCGRWFELAASRGTSRRAPRSDRETCSTSCRSKAYRERQDKARQLHTQGKPFKEIAKELGSKVATVKGWITGQKG